MRLTDHRVLVAAAVMATGCDGVFGLTTVEPAGPDAAVVVPPDGLTGTGFCGMRCDESSGTCICIDFDTGQVPPEWALSTAGESIGTVWAEDAFSQPFAFRMVHVASTMGTPGSSFTVLKRGIVTTARRVSFELAVRITPPDIHDAYSNIELASISLTGSGRAAWSWIHDPTAAEVDRWAWNVGYLDASNNYVITTVPVAAPPLDRWFTMRVAMDLVADATGTLAVTHDVDEVLRVNAIQTAGPNGGGEQTVGANIGAGTLQGMTPTFTLLHDNVLLRVAE